MLSMEVIVAVPPGTQPGECSAALVGLRCVDVTVGVRRISVQLPAPGDAASCAATLRPAGASTELLISVRPLAAGAPEPEPQVAPAPAAVAAAAVSDPRRMARVNEIAKRLAALAEEEAAAAAEATDAKATLAAAAEAGTKRRGQMARLEQMTHMEPEQLAETVASVGVGSPEEFVAKLRIVINAKVDQP